MAKQRNNIKPNKPAIFDWLVFTISLILGLIFPDLKDLVASPSFSMWMLVALVLYITGLWLKHLPVHYRLAKQGRREGSEVNYLLYLMIGHWLTMLAAVLIADKAFRHITFLPPVNKDEPKSAILWVLISAVVAVYITWFAFRGPKHNSKPLTEKYLFRRELAGDIVLISGVSILSFVFWEKSVLGAVAHMRMDSFGSILLLFIALAAAYMVFYLPLRYLYLIDDHGRQMWRRMLLIFVLILVRGLFETLRF